MQRRSQQDTQQRQASAEGLMSDIERESMEFDVVIVGAGPAGLAAVSYTHLTLPTILRV